MNTPIEGERSVAQAPEGGGQSLAQTGRSRPPAVASDFPGFQLNGAEAGCRPKAVAGRAIPVKTMAAVSTLNTRRRARQDIHSIVPAVASRPVQARVPERYTEAS